MKTEMYEKMLASIESGQIAAKKLHILYANAEHQGDEQGRDMMAHIIEYSERHETKLYRKLVPVN
jgi:hypothetical protein